MQESPHIPSASEKAGSFVPSEIISAAHNLVSGEFVLSPLLFIIASLPDAAFGLLSDNQLLGFLGSATSFLLYPFAVGITIHQLLTARSDGAPRPLSESFDFSVRNWSRYLTAMILCNGLTGGVVILCTVPIWALCIGCDMDPEILPWTTLGFAAIVATWLMVKTSLTYPILCDQNHGVTDSIKKSFRMCKGKGSEISLVYLSIFAITAAAFIALFLFMFYFGWKEAKRGVGIMSLRETGETVGGLCGFLIGAYVMSLHTAACTLIYRKLKP